MQLFCVKPIVSCFDRLHDFAAEFSLGQEDLILTESVLFDSYIQKEHLPCPVILKDRYDPGEPKEEVIDAILQDIRDLPVRRIIAVGGGSVIDIAKILCVKDAYPCRRVMEQTIPMILDKELIVLPSTCGTGSEVTFGGIVTMKDTGFKTGVLAQQLSSAHAVLVPELLTGLPMKVFIHCSVDAMVHAMESYVSATRGNEMVRAVGGRAVTLLMNGYAALAVNGEGCRPGLMKQFLTASCLAGMAVNNGGAGPVHALAYPVGETYKMSHGESIYQFLTEVFSFYERTADGPLLEELRQIKTPALQRAGVYTGDPFRDTEKLLNALYPPRRLRECGMTEADVEPFVANIFQAKQRLLAASYAPFAPEDAAAIYRARL